MSEPEPQDQSRLETALREAQEWRAKALHTQAAAETLQKKAHLLKSRAEQALEKNKELTLALRKTQAVAKESHQKAIRQSQEIQELRNSTDQAHSERESALIRLSGLEQQLSLYQTALDEHREGKDLEQILRAIETTYNNPKMEEHLLKQLGQCQVELAAAVSQRDALREDMWANRAVLENKADQLYEEKKELEASVQDLYHTLEKVISDNAFRERELDGRLRDTLLELKVTKRALREKEKALEVIEGDSQVLIEELHAEAEDLRSEIGILNAEKLELEDLMSSQISQLEDERSDLEIVNADLFQKIAELESE